MQVLVDAGLILKQEQEEVREEYCHATDRILSEPSGARAVRLEDTCNVPPCLTV